MKRFNALVAMVNAPQSTRRNLLMHMTKAPTRRNMLMKQAVNIGFFPVPFFNKQGRQFHVTRSGAYVIRERGKTLYGRKAVFTPSGRIRNFARVPTRLKSKKR